jgi:hypothetical protein
MLVSQQPTVINYEFDEADSAIFDNQGTPVDDQNSILVQQTLSF